MDKLVNDNISKGYGFNSSVDASYFLGVQPYRYFKTISHVFNCLKQIAMRVPNISQNVVSKNGTDVVFN